MINQNFFWSTNIKFLRNRKKLSQDQLAVELTISRAKLNAHENGHSKNPPLEDLVRFADYFNITIDTLLRINLSKLSELKLRNLEAGNDIYLSGRQIRVLATTINQQNNENIEWVPIKAKAGYLAGYNDLDFISKLPKFSMPNLPVGKTYRLFPTKGDSMLPVPEDSYVIGEYVEDWLTLKKDTPCIVVVKGQDIVFKLMDLSDTPRTHRLYLKSLNVRYSPYEIEAVDVLEVWKFYGYISDTMPEQLNLQEMTYAINDMKMDLQKLVKTQELK